MRRLEAMVEAAWNLTEPYRPMAHVSDADRELLHADHAHMLEAFTAGDVAALMATASAHHDRLLAAVRAALTGGDADHRGADRGKPLSRPVDPVYTGSCSDFQTRSNIC